MNEYASINLCATPYKKESNYSRYHLRAPSKIFFFRFKPAFWWTSIDRYYGFSRVGELWLSETELRGKFTIGGREGGGGFDFERVNLCHLGLSGGMLPL